MAGEPAGLTVPVSRERVENCLKSATFWVRELPRYADRKQAWADAWGILSGVLAAVTGLAIFPAITDASTDWDKALVSMFAFGASICALMPRIKNYAELAGQARELTSRYGGVVGDLLDLSKANPFPAEAAQTVIEEFEAIKEKKDSLRGLPDRDAIELRRVETERRLVEAEAALAAAKATTDAG
jgi:hypothetical protein